MASPRTHEDQKSIVPAQSAQREAGGKIVPFVQRGSLTRGYPHGGKSTPVARAGVRNARIEMVDLVM